MNFSIKTKQDKFLEKTYESAMAEFSTFFKLDWKYNRPNIIIVPDRKTINELKGEKTEDWVVGWSKGGDIYILDRKNYSKESCHKNSDEEYANLLRHELAHAFTNIISGYNDKPKWLWEGVALFLSGQTNSMKRPPKLSNFLKFHDIHSKYIYAESGFAVKFLVEKFGKTKLLRLLSSMKTTRTKSGFMKSFKQIYGSNLNYRFFNDR